MTSIVAPSEELARGLAHGPQEARLSAPCQGSIRGLLDIHNIPTLLVCLGEGRCVYLAV
jgi:hypothetical protein